jgi:lysyl-tRNA synthetase class 1
MTGERRERDPYLNHWADHAADKTLRAHPDAKQIVVAAGITPSGVVHIGNFREVITVDLVARALADRGVEVRFIYSWDDFDVFRKVPADAPQQEMLNANLRKSIADVPDPWGTHESYAAHNIARLEESITPLGIAPEFIRQHAMYRSGKYAEGIRAALQHAAKIRDLINTAREATGARSRLADDWLPLAGFCTQCGIDDLAFDYDGDWTVQVHCNGCGHDEAVDLRNGGDLKLPWRVDWPMRWAYEKVSFEPGGKDHSSAGGSYDTAKGIVREIYAWTAPQYVGYDFVTAKGQGGKISSSKGGVVDVTTCLQVYEPEVLRWMFSSYRPNTEFAISFDLDVIKIYEDYDRAVRLAHEAEDGSKKDKKRQTARRTLELAAIEPGRIEPGSTPPTLIAFRHLSTVLQTYDGDIAATAEYFVTSGELPEADRARFEQRARCVWNWVEQYAPEDFCYRIRTEPVVREIPAEQQDPLRRLVEILESDANPTETDLGGKMSEMSKSGVDMKAFFPVVYDLLLGRDRGPKMSTLLAIMTPARALPLLKPSVG